MNNHTLGIVLTELMVAMAISLLLFSFLLSMYINGQQSHSLQSQLQSIQDNATTASYLLTSAVEQAGYIGCPKLSDHFPLVSLPDYTITSENKLVVTPDHTIIIRHADVNHVILQTSMQDQSLLNASDNLNFHPGEILIISDCQHAEIFRVAEVRFKHSIQMIVTSAPLQQSFMVGAEIARFNIDQYFIAITGRKTDEGEPLFALYNKDINHQLTELVSGIDKMQFFYSVKEAGKLIEVPAIENIADIKGVSIEFELAESRFKKKWYIFVSL